MKYFTCYNNGVTALVSAEVSADMVKAYAIRSILTDENHRVQGRDYSKPLSEGLRHIGTPIFTFTRPERLKDSPWFTGDIHLLHELCHFLEVEGAVIESSGFYVPFSNGCEIGSHGDQAMAMELSHVTTNQQFLDTFGVSCAELQAKALATEKKTLEREAFLAGLEKK